VDSQVSLVTPGFPVTLVSQVSLALAVQVFLGSPAHKAQADSQEFLDIPVFLVSVDIQGLAAFLVTLGSLVFLVILDSQEFPALAVLAFQVSLAHREPADFLVSQEYLDTLVSVVSQEYLDFLVFRNRLLAALLLRH